jgi:hypothetical protein
VASRFASVSTTEGSARDPVRKGWFTGLDLTIIAGREVPLALATLSLGAGAIHFAVISEHFTEYWLFGVFFATLGWYQAIWAVLYTLRPGRMLGFTALLMNAGAAALWLWTRTVGVPIGPKAGKLEPIGAPDVAAMIFEAAIVAGLLWYIAARRSAPPGASTTSPSRGWLLGGLIVLVTTTTALVLFLPSS